jgi:RNA polymerase sigma factor (TIGR02999 family)
VHEADLRLVGPAGEGGDEEAVRWQSRGHFFAAAAEAMRRILVDQARRRHAAKRGGQANRQELHESAIAAPEPDEDLLGVHEAVDDLAAVDPLAAQLVKLRFFAGLTMAQAAEALGMSLRSAHSLWAYARTWLHRRLRSS